MPSSVPIHILLRVLYKDEIASLAHVPNWMIVRLLQKNDGNRGHWTLQTESSASVSSIAIGLVFS